MSLLDVITGHHDDEKQHVEDALPAQKIRVSLERRIYNAQKLILEEVPEDNEELEHKKHVALAKLHEFRLAVEEMMNAVR